MTQRLQLLSAFQVLSMPDGCFNGNHHETALGVLYDWSTRRLTVAGTQPPVGLGYDAYVAWWEANSTPCCEHCDGPMPEENDLGVALVCDACAEDYEDDCPSDYSERMAERRAMGFSNF